MKPGWQEVKLRDLLLPSEDWIQISPAERYWEVTVKLWGKGAIPRREVSGAEIAATRRKGIKAGQLILSKIDARNGALGIVPSSLDGAVVSNDFPVYYPNREKILPGYLGWLVKTSEFVNLCRLASEGTTNRIRLQEQRFLSFSILLPPPSEQRQITQRLGTLASKILEARQLHEQIAKEAQAMLLSALNDIIKDAQRRPMSQTAPIVRRPIEVQPDAEYPELGVRSFGRGTFHKPSLSGAAIGSKRLFGIEPGDLVFNNVFAWEGAVAVAKSQDSGRVGSHRFITCVPHQKVARAEFLLACFLTKNGLTDLGAASPGGAGRNRTLGVEALQKIMVPLPSLDKQDWFVQLRRRVQDLLTIQNTMKKQLDGLLASAINRSFSEKAVEQSRQWPI